MSNYRGYFRGFDRAESNNPNGDLYCVHIGDFSAETYTEVLMAGEAPFVVSYNTSETPFEPIRTSTATIKFLNNNYMEDILPSTAMETPVHLYNETAGRLEWCGYLTPKIYDNNYTECLETIQLEAADCVSVLQYCKYAIDEYANSKQIVSLRSILAQICSATSLISEFQCSRGRYYGDVEVCPDTIYLSEANFFSSDTDEPWKLSEVLEEICRYFGYTAIQFQDKLVMVDYLYYSGGTESIPVKTYKKSIGWTFYLNQNLTNANTTINQGEIRSSEASISFSPVFNKCVVKDNMYAAERLIPSIFDDNLLRNRIDTYNFYASYQCTVPSPDKPTYPWGSVFLGIGQDYTDDGSGDSKYTYYHRIYDNKYWKSMYDYQPVGQPPATQQYLVDHVGGTIIDLGVVKNTYISDYDQTIVPSKLDFTRYLAINQSNNGYMGTNDGYYAFRLSGYTINCPYNPDNAFLVIQGSAIFEKYYQRPYINPDWSTNYVKLGGTGNMVRTDGCLNFKVKIGDNYWNGKKWVSGSTAFSVVLERSSKDYGVYNKEMHVLNNVHYSLGVGEDGYIIPLSGTNVGDSLQVDILLPKIQTELNNEKHYNGWCWIKDLDIKLVQKGQSEEKDEGDVVYENIIEEDAVNEIREITCKLSTYYSGVAPSYSTVLIESGGTKMVMSGFTSPGLVEAKEGEYNIVERYVQQYSTPTKKISMVVESNGAGRRNPWTYYKGLDVDNPAQIFVELGSEIDYQAGTKNFTAIELKV